MELKQSKSAKKREYLELQVLGEQLIGFPEDELREMQLDDTLIRAIVAAASITSHGARRRQHQLIGKLMKHTDPEPVREALNAKARSTQQPKQEFKQAEKWRDRILKDGQDGIRLFIESTGRENSALLGLVNDYSQARTEPNRRALSRRIFRQVHEHLSAGEENGAA